MTFTERLYLNFIKDSRWHYLTDGLLVTLEVTFFAVLLGIVIGVVIAAVRSTHDKLIEQQHLAMEDLIT